MQTHGDVNLDGRSTHIYEEAEPDNEPIDPGSIHMRVERQTLYRLPVSRAIVFLVKTYVTPPEEVVDGKLENARQLLAAEHGMSDAGELGRYKSVPRWGPPVEAYLQQHIYELS